MGFFSDFLAPRHASGGLIPTFSEAVQQHPHLRELKGLVKVLKNGHARLSVRDDGSHYIETDPDRKHESCLDCEVNGHLLAQTISDLDSPRHNDLVRTTLWSNLKNHLARSNEIRLNPSAIVTNPPLPRYNIEPLLLHQFFNLSPAMRSPHDDADSLSFEEHSKAANTKLLAQHILGYAHSIPPSWSTFMPSNFRGDPDEVSNRNQDLGQYGNPEDVVTQKMLHWKRENPLHF